MKQCKDFCDRLSDYLDGQLEGNLCELIEQHLEVCPPCALMYESLKQSVDLCCKGLRADLPEDVAMNLKHFLRTHCKGKQAHLREEHN